LSLTSFKNLLASGIEIGADENADPGADGQVAAMDFSAIGNNEKDAEMEDAGNKVGDMRAGTGASTSKDELDLREFSITSDLISHLLIRLLQENDNSENPFDDSFYISKILTNLGKLDNFEYMP